MITLKKDPDRDFIILNLTDLHDQSPEIRDVMTETTTKLIHRVKPDLITISGDFMEAHREGAEADYTALAHFLDSFQIPWAPVWGNHDKRDMAEQYLVAPSRYCLFEKGDPAFGSGNYVISIEENGQPVEGIFMMDSHSGSLYPGQIAWYRAQAQALKDRGCYDTTMIMHIPIFAFAQAFDEAYNGHWVKKTARLRTFRNKDCWTEKYQDSVGAQLEDVSPCEAGDGSFEAIRELGTTKTVIAGHDHINNWIINYQGVRLAYGLKTGAGGYLHPWMNGGTVLRVTSSGVAEVYHENVSPKLKWGLQYLRFAIHNILRDLRQKKEN